MNLNDLRETPNKSRREDLSNNFNINEEENQNKNILEDFNLKIESKDFPSFQNDMSVSFLKEKTPEKKEKRKKNETEKLLNDINIYNTQ